MIDIEWKFDATKMINAIDRTFPSIEKQAENAVRKHARLQRQEAMKLAPKKTGKLSRGIKVKQGVEGFIGTSGGYKKAQVVSNAMNKGFNYAYFHEYVYPAIYGSSYKNPTTPGTQPAYMWHAKENTEKQFEEIVYKSMKTAFRNAGWRVMG
jgi:hypothetical protein